MFIRANTVRKRVLRQMEATRKQDGGPKDTSREKDHVTLYISDQTMQPDSLFSRGTYQISTVDAELKPDTHGPSFSYTSSTRQGGGVQASYSKVHYAYREDDEKRYYLAESRYESHRMHPTHACLVEEDKASGKLKVTRKDEHIFLPAPETTNTGYSNQMPLLMIMSPPGARDSWDWE